MFPTRIGRRIILAASLLPCAGCSTTNTFGREKLQVPVGPSYVAGRGIQMFPTSERLLPNVKEAMADVGMRSIHQVPEPNDAIAIEATTADNRSARVTIQSTGVRSLLGVKVGWLGDEPLTRALLDRLATRQGTLPPDAVPVEPEATPSIAESSGNAFLSRKAVPDSVMLRDQLDPGFDSSLQTPPIRP